MMRFLEEILALTRSPDTLDPIARRRAPSDLELRRLWEMVGGRKHALEVLLKWGIGESHEPSILGGAWTLMPVGKIMTLLESLMRRPIAMWSSDDGIDVPPVWHPEWVPFVSWNSVIVGVLDSRESSSSHWPVLGVRLDDGEVVYWAETLEAFFGRALNEIARDGRLSVDLLMRGR